jgi:hypothetical protein
MAGPPDPWEDPAGEPPRPRLTREALRRAPHLGWSALVDLVTTVDNWQRLGRARRVAWLAFHYDADVTTGGHRRFLERADVARRTATREALDELDARAQRPVLERAVALADLGGSLRAIADCDLDALDHDYHACAPEIPQLLERWLAERLPEFVVLD